MSITKSIVAGIAVAVVSTSAFAGDMNVYAVPSAHNFCPDGLQPITMSGVICCGTPNTTKSYQHMMAHPAPKKKHHTHKVRHVQAAQPAHSCPEGQKGCF